MMQGYRTILYNIIALLAVWLNEKFGIILELKDQEAIVATIIIAGNIYLRIKTTTPVFKKEIQNVKSDKISSEENNEKAQNNIKNDEGFYR
jgi:hypothetical protein